MANIQDDLFEFKPSVYHRAEGDSKKIFYVWGHSYEFDIYNTWDKFEEFLKMMSGKSDIAYLTNKEALL